MPVYIPILAGFVLAVGLVLLLIEPRASIVRQEEPLQARVQGWLDRAPGVGAYRRYQEKVTARAQIGAAHGTLLGDVALFLSAGRPTLEAAIFAGAQQVPEHHAWRQIVLRAQRLTRPGEDFVEMLRRELREIGGATQELSLDLAVLRALSTTQATAQLADSAREMAANAKAKAYAAALEKAHQIPVKMSLLMVGLFLPAALAFSVGDVLWEFLLVLGGIGR